MKYDLSNLTVRNRIRWLQENLPPLKGKFILWGENNYQGQIMEDNGETVLVDRFSWMDGGCTGRVTLRKVDFIDLNVRFFDDQKTFHWACEMVSLDETQRFVDADKKREGHGAFLRPFTEATPSDEDLY